MAKKQYRFISEMGESTCKVCRSYHGKVFSEDKLPKLPLHPNCRCRSVLMGESSLAKEDESDMPMEKLKELNDYYEYLIFDDDGNIIGIHPRNDLRGVTIGFGHFISYKEMAEDLKLMKLAKRNLSIEEAYELLKKDLDLNSSKDKFPLPPTLSKKPKIQPKAEPEDQIITSIDPNRAYSPWDKFETPNLAAIAFGLTYADYGDSMGREIGALIYAIPWNGDIPNHYTFGDIYEGAEGNVIGLLVWHVLTHLIPPTEYELLGRLGAYASYE